MKLTLYLMASLFFVSNEIVFAQERDVSPKHFSEGVLEYDIFIENGSDKNAEKTKLASGTQTVFIKSYLSRIDVHHPLLVQSTIIDKKNGTYKMLKSLGANQYLIELNRKNWDDLHRKYQNAAIEYFEEYKMIAGIKCQKVLVKFSNGDFSTAYFTRELLADHRDFELAYQALPGLVMEYVMALGNYRITYRIAKLNFSMVPVSKFELPKSGYRIMSFEESQQFQ